MKSQAFHILMAEDDPTICLIVPMILRRLGHEVRVVHNGRDAIAEFDAKPGHYQVLLTDHDMPQANGLEVVTHMRAQGFSGRIVVMSGSLSDDLMHAYFASRVDKILQKPFTLEMLSANLSELLEQWGEGKAES